MASSMPPHAERPKSATNKQQDITLYPLLTNDFSSDAAIYSLNQKTASSLLKSTR
jgi:hypothetical protein